MDRREFLGLAATATIALGNRKRMALTDLNSIASGLTKSEKLPAFFLGHGNPMNAIEDNAFTRSLSKMASSIEVRPQAILCVSAHWLTRGTFVATTPRPETIHDFGGFPPELFAVQYPAPGAPEAARETKALSDKIQEDTKWGLDHGAWSVLKHMFPKADIPVYQLSIDYYQLMQYHFDLAKQLIRLRERGVLIVGSGNIVHNLRLWFSAPADRPFDWAVEFDEWSKQKIESRDFRALVEYDSLGPIAKLAVPTVDHYVPMLYSLGVAGKDEQIAMTYEEVLGAGSMRCFRIG